MANFTELLAQAASAEISANDLPTSTKTQAVSQAAAQKKADMYRIAASSGMTVNNPSNPLEADLRTLTPLELSLKYGANADALIEDRANAALDVSRDRAISARDPLTATGDFLSGAAAALASAVGSVGAVGGGLVDTGIESAGFQNPGIGLAISNAIDEGNQYIQGLQSDKLNASRRLTEAQKITAELDNAAQYEVDRKTDGDFIAGLKQTANDAMDTVSVLSDDPTALMQGTADAVGSLFATGKIVKGLEKVGKAVVSGARTAKVPEAVLDTATKVGTAASVPLAVGTLGAAGSFSDTATDVAGMDTASLAQTSPEFVSLVQENIAAGMDQTSAEEAAKTSLATEAGLTAAAITAPVATGLGVLVRKFEGNPLGRSGVKNIVPDAAKETVQESLEGATQGVASNIAKQQLVDENQNLAEGVGRQVGEGALYGLTSTVAVQSPKAAVDTSLAAIKATAKAAVTGTKATMGALGEVVKPAANYFRERGEKLRQANEAASPVSDEIVAEAAAQAVQDAPVNTPVMKEAIDTSPDLTPEEKAQANDYIDRLTTVMQFPEEEIASPDVPQRVKDLVAGSTNRFEALQRLADDINTQELASDEQYDSAITFMEMLAPVSPYTEMSPDAIDSLAPGSAADQLIRNYAALTDKIQSNAKIARTLRSINQNFAIAQEQGKVTPITEENVATPEGQRNAKLTAAIITNDLSKGDLDNNQNLLFQYEKGNVKLTEAQVRAVRSSIAILQAKKKYNEEVARQGLKTKKDIVSEEVTSKNDPVSKIAKSALAHTRDVLSAKDAGNDDLASARLIDFGKFVQHMQNKVSALNTHFLNGDPKADRVPYDALQPTVDRNFKRTSVEQGMSVNPNVPSSVDFARTVALEAKVLADVFNSLSDALPELNAGHVDVVPLDSGLDVQVSQSVTSPPEENTVSTVTVAQDVSTETVQKVTEPLEETTPEQVVETTPTTTGVASVYPNLIQGSTVKEALAIPANPVSRLTGSAEPLTVIADAIVDQDSLESFVGSEVESTVTEAISEAYGEYLSLAPALIDALNTRLKAFAKKNKLDELLAGGQEPFRWVRGKVLNIVEQTVKDFAYNQELIESASLAALQWVLDARDGLGQVEDEDILKMTGLSYSQLDADTVARLKSGVSLEFAKQTLATKVREYWGLKASKDIPMGKGQAVFEAMAAELLRALESAGAVELDAVSANGKTFNRFKINSPKATDGVVPPLLQFPNLIDTAVLVERDDVVYTGNAPLRVATTQLRRPQVPLTADQKTALENEQKTEFKLNTPMVDLIRALGSAGIARIFEGSIDTKRKYNKNHLKSLDGKARTAIAAYDSLFETVAIVQNRADKAGIALTDMPIKYRYEFSSVNRMQMQGRYNPQSNKLIREAILPTTSTLDLSNPDSDDSKAFNLAIAQAFGIKVHNVSYEVANKKLSDQLVKLEPMIEMISDFIGSDDKVLPPAAIDVIVDSLEAAGADVSMVAIHAVHEYARLQKQEDKSSFTTALYLEADGVTNGLANAMAILTPGEFTPEQLKMSAKVGLSVGSEKTLAQLRAEDSKDLYETTADALKENLKAARRGLATSKDNRLLPQMDALLRVMNVLLPGFEINDKQFNVSRNITKNPLTQFIYGAQVPSVSMGIAEQIIDQFYAKLSDVAEQMEKNPSLEAHEIIFPNDPNSAAKWQSLWKDLRNLTAVKARLTSKGIVLETLGNGVSRQSPEDFTFGSTDVELLASNVSVFFGQALFKSVKDTVGSGLFNAMESVGKLTQVKSVLGQYMFQQKIKDALEAKKNDPDWKTGDFLSENEILAIEKEVIDSIPLVQTGKQNFYVSKQIKATGLGPEYSRALDDTLGTSPQFFVPSDSGVAGIPFLNIGMGDGLMMQLLSLMSDVKGTLKIFDGMNMPLNKIKEYSALSNEAVNESWQGNPLKAVVDSMGDFNKLFAAFDGPKEMYLAMLPPFDEYKALDKATLKSMVIDEVTMTAALASASADSIDARHKALQSVKYSVDQMAAAASPAVFGTAEDMTQEEALDALNAAYEQAIKPVEPKKETPVSFGSVGRVLKSGVRSLSVTSLKTLAKAGIFNPAQRTVFDQIMRTLTPKNYSIVIGTGEQLRAYQRETGRAVLSDEQMQIGRARGITSIDDKVIYLLEPSAETLVHELVHAATYEAIYAHYMGDSTPEVADAVARLEKMKEDFMSLSDAGMDVETAIAYQNARDAILSEETKALTDEVLSKANALNEFMAWALTNGKIASYLGQVKVNPLVSMAKRALVAIKKIIWGKAIAPKPADDFLSNLQFNSSVIIRSQPSVSEMVSGAQLYQTSYNVTSERLNGIRELFKSKIVDYIQESPTKIDLRSKAAPIKERVISSAALAINVQANGFGMTAQEASTFNMVISALGTETDLNTAALSQLQELYSHVVKNITVESFMDDPDANDPNDRYLAQERYNAIVGRNLIQRDAKGRSSLLPVFLALSMVNEDFRKVLTKIPVPKLEKNKDRTLDATLDNFGAAMMDSMSRRLSGQKNAPDVQAAIDAMIDKIKDTAIDDQHYALDLMNRAGESVDALNEMIVKKKDELSDKGMALGEDLQKSTNKSIRALGKVTQLMSSILSESNGEKVSISVTKLMNTMNVPQTFNDFLTDLIGRNASNSGIFDMIKAVRTQVQQDRQQYREHVPEIIAGAFSRKLEDKEWTTLFRALGKTDIASLRSAMSNKKIMEIFSNPDQLDTLINEYEQRIQSAFPKDAATYARKMKQLAGFMMTGSMGNNLLRNAYAIANLFGESKSSSWAKPNAADQENIDQLITLYAIEKLSKVEKQTLASLVQSESAGIDFVTSYLVGQRQEEVDKTGDASIGNQYKGYIPSINEEGGTLIVGSDSEYAKLISQGYTRVRKYEGSSIDRGLPSMSYYYLPVSGRAMFNQGIVQNINQTSGGVSASNGFTVGLTAGLITDKDEVKRITKWLMREGATNEPLLPVYDKAGNVYAYERSIDSRETLRLSPNTNLSQMIGVWRGRQIEEAKSQMFNFRLVDELANTYKKDISESAGNKEQYVNIFDSAYLNTDPVLKYAVDLMPSSMKDYIKSQFGDEFLVRKDMLKDVFGYPAASIGDFWTDNTRWSAQTSKAVKDTLLGMFGNTAYQKLVTAEKVLQNVVADAKVLIAVKSIVVPMLNVAANVHQLIGRGVPLISIVRGTPSKVSELNRYMEIRLKKIEVEAKIEAATTDAILTRKLKVELQSLRDAERRMSIWPLIEAGEFSAIADIGITEEELNLSNGKFMTYIEGMINKLPPSVRTAGRYAFITKDTALYQALQKSVLFGDFVAKAILFDDLVKRQKKSKEYALGRITEEFVNYDRLPGRFRGYMESVGLLWFYNFKLRIAKIAVSTVRNNPLHALLAAGVGTVGPFDSVGSPMEDNVFAKAVDGSLGYSIGIEQGLSAPSMNPWANVAF